MDDATREQIADRLKRIRGMCQSSTWSSNFRWNINRLAAETELILSSSYSVRNPTSPHVRFRDVESGELFRFPDNPTAVYQRTSERKYVPKGKSELLYGVRIGSINTAVLKGEQ